MATGAHGEVDQILELTLLPRYFDLLVGNPMQTVEVEIDLLSPDTQILITTSGKGSKFDIFNSSSLSMSLKLLPESAYHLTNVVNTGEYVHPLCQKVFDEVQLFHSSDLINSHPSLSLTLCTAPRYSTFTRLPSGATFGLSVQSDLHQGQDGMLRISRPASLLQVLHDAGGIHRKIASITLLDATSGVLTLGGTIAQDIEIARVRSEVELDVLGQRVTIAPDQIAAQIDSAVQQRILSFPQNLDDQFKWLPSSTSAKSTSGTFSGWWTPLMSGLWINGNKALRNQPTLLDLQCPFILAPPVAAQAFYASIGGARKLEPKHAEAEDKHARFWLIPCSNPASIAFEISGWMFPALRDETRDDAIHGPVGGPQSLGLWKEGTGYCVGVVVESRMQGKDWIGTGLQHSWVLGEQFFKGMGVVFDMKEGKIGLRTY